MKSERGSLFQPLKASLRAKVTLGVVVPLTLILGIFTAIEATRHREVELRNLTMLASQSGKVVESSLRHAMLEANFTEVQMILDTIGEKEDFQVVYLLDTKGEVVFAPQSKGVGDRLDNNNPSCQPCHKLPPEDRPGSVVVNTVDGQRVFRSMYPIKNAPECTACHDPNEPFIGLLLTDIPVSPVESVLADDLRENILWWVGTIVVTVLVVNLAMNRIVIQRLQRLAQALIDFGQDRLGIRLPVEDPDEIGQLAVAFNKMGNRIEAEVAENRSLSDHLYLQNKMRGELLNHLITAQEDERKRVARELHDDLGQALGALSLQSEAVELLILTDPESAIKQLNLTRDLITETTERMYELILALRPSTLDDLGLIAALQAHADRFLNGSGIAFEVNTNGMTSRLSPEIETALYRIYQEALNNVRRHSGARRVSITLEVHDGVLESEIQDDGHGFDPQAIESKGDSPRGLGLLGIKERVKQLCGNLDIISQPGSGTRIHLCLPLTEVDGE